VLACHCAVPGCEEPTRQPGLAHALSARRESYLRRERARPLTCVAHADLSDVEQAARARVRDLLIAASRSLVGKLPRAR
jgi:hypothetical protein